MAGALPGNTNALKHGERASPDRQGFVIPSLARKYARGWNDCCRIRAYLERVYIAQTGCHELPPSVLATIQAITRLEMSCRVAEKSIRDDKDMDPEKAVKFMVRVNEWTEKRNKLIAELVGEQAVKPVEGAAWDAAVVEVADESASSSESASGSVEVLAPVTPSTPAECPPPGDDLPRP